MSTIKALEFYSGIGGLHLALKRSNVNATIVHAFDWDPNACEVYSTNYGSGIARKIDIATISPVFLASLDANLWLMSPSCQPYTVLNPLAKGDADPRAESFLYIIEDVLPQLVALKAQPDYMLVENVAGFESSSTRRRLLSVLKSLGYTTFETLLTPLQFGIPNSRLRYYLLAKQLPLTFQCPQSVEDEKIWRCIPGQCEVWVDPRMHDKLEPHNAQQVESLRLYLDEDVTREEGISYEVPEKVLNKWGRLFDIVYPSSQRTCCFTRGYTQLVERTGSILQLNEKLDTTKVFDAFLRAKSEGDDTAVVLLRPLKLRYFSPSELLRLFHFENLSSHSQDGRDAFSFVWPKRVSLKTKYRLIGNSVNVKVVIELINFLFK